MENNNDHLQPLLQKHTSNATPFKQRTRTFFCASSPLTLTTYLLLFFFSAYAATRCALYALDGHNTMANVDYERNRRIAYTPPTSRFSRCALASASGAKLYPCGAKGRKLYLAEAQDAADVDWRLDEIVSLMVENQNRREAWRWRSSRYDDSSYEYGSAYYRYSSSLGLVALFVPVMVYYATLLIFLARKGFFPGSGGGGNPVTFIPYFGFVVLDLIAAVLLYSAAGVLVAGWTAGIRTDLIIMSLVAASIQFFHMILAIVRLAKGVPPLGSDQGRVRLEEDPNV